MADPRTPGPGLGDDRETLAFVHELARDVSPVERIARLRTGAGRVLALWGVVTVAAVLGKGLADPLTNPTCLAGGYGAVLAGLVLMGAGGVLAALAAAVPGREPLARAGAVVLAAGLVVALGVGGALLRSAPLTSAPATVASDLACLATALVLAVLPALGALVYVVRAAPPQPVAVLLGIGAGSVALGAFTTQLGCADLTLRHLLVSHALAPAIGAVLLVAPLWLAFRRFRER